MNLNWEEKPQPQRSRTANNPGLRAGDASAKLALLVRRILTLQGNRAFQNSVEGNTEHTAGAGVDTEDTGGRFAWSDENVETLKQSWNSGHSAGQIARIFGGKVSRSAVIGKVRRLKLPFRDHCGSLSNKARRGNLTRVRSLTALATVTGRLERQLFPNRPTAQRSLRSDPIPAPLESDVARVSFLDLEEHHCRFVCGEVKGPFVEQFCGEQRIPGSAYCEAHAHRCGEGSRIQQRYVAPNTGRVMLNAAGSLAGEMESA